MFIRALLCVLVAAFGVLSIGYAGEPSGHLSVNSDVPLIAREYADLEPGPPSLNESPVADVFQPVSYQRRRGGGGFQRPRRVSLLAYIGRNTPHGDFSDRAEDSFIWGVGMRVSVIRYYALALNFRTAPRHHYTVALRDQRVNAGANDGGDGKYRANSLTLDHYFSIPMMRILFGIRPVLIAGAGMYNISSDPDEAGVLPGDTDSETGLGFNVGAGISLGGGPGGGLSLDLRYQTAKDGYRAFSLGAGVSIPIY